jgi:uncharacterized membrane-anchored protein YjiN (DUF445 family)
MQAQLHASGPETDDLVAAGLARLVKDGIRSRVADDVLALLRRTVDERRDLAVGFVQDRSRWWIASAVDRRVAHLIVDGLLLLLDELRSDRSQLGSPFVTAFDQIVDELVSQRELTRIVSYARHHLAGSRGMERLVLRIARRHRDRLLERIAEDPGRLSVPIAGLVRDLAAQLLADKEICVALDSRIADVASRLLADLRPAIGGYVTAVVSGWRPEELNNLFEAEIGPDLQYIRINGAVLGSLIGGALFGLETLLG